jgi:hypothetical protein
MNDRKSQITLELDDFRMLKMLCVERQESVENIIHALLRIIHEQVDHAYETGEVSPDLEGFSMTLFKALHLKKLGALTAQEFTAVVGNADLHHLIDRVFEADGLKERRRIMDASRNIISSA